MAHENRKPIIMIISIYFTIIHLCPTCNSSNELLKQIPKGLEINNNDYLQFKVGDTILLRLKPRKHKTIPSTSICITKCKRK